MTEQQAILTTWFIVPDSAVCFDNDDTLCQIFGCKTEADNSCERATIFLGPLPGPESKSQGQEGTGKALASIVRRWAVVPGNVLFVSADTTASKT